MLLFCWLVGCLIDMTSDNVDVDVDGGVAIA